MLQQASDLDDSVEDKLLVGDRPKPSIDPDTKLPWKERLSKRSQAELDEVILIKADCVIADPLFGSSLRTKCHSLTILSHLPIG